MSVPGPHVLTPDTVALWQFKRDLLDSGPNALHLEVGTGSLRYTHMVGTIWGVWGPSTSPTTGLRLARPIHDPVLDIKGDITLMFFGVKTSQAVTMGFNPGVVFLEAGEAEAANSQWYCTATDNSLTWIQEHGDGLNDTIYVGANRGMGTCNVPYHVAARRRNQKVQLFLDGLPVTAESATFTEPTGGSSSRLFIPDVSSGLALSGMASLRIDSVARSDDYIRNTYNSTLGLFKGHR